MDNNIISAEMIRGHIDTIILLSLKDADRDSNEIRSDIEAKSDNKYSVKQGTFYSAMQRLVKQNYIKEYRSSATDGIRRKYFSLTEKGRKFLEKSLAEWNQSKVFIDDLMDAPSAPVKKEIPQVEESDDFDEFKNLASDIGDFSVESSDTSADEYLKDIGENVFNDLMKDLSENDDSDNVKVDKIQENSEEFDYNYDLETDADDELPINENTVDENDLVEEIPVIVENKPVGENVVVLENNDDVNPIENEDEKDVRSETKHADSDSPAEDFEDKKRDYKSLLSKLFPKDAAPSLTEKYEEPKEEDVKSSQINLIDDYDELSANTIIKNDNPSDEEKNQTTSSEVDFSDLYAMANREGFKIKTSNLTNSRPDSGIYINKLRCHASLIFYALLFVEMLIMHFAFSPILNWSSVPIIVIPIAFFVFPLSMLIAYFIDSNAVIEEVSPFKNAVELALIIVFQLIIIILGVALFAYIDLGNIKQLLSFIVIPVIFAVNVPLYVIIKYSLLSTDKYTKK